MELEAGRRQLLLSWRRLAAGMNEPQGRGGGPELFR